MNAHANVDTFPRAHTPDVRRKNRDIYALLFSFVFLIFGLVRVCPSANIVRLAIATVGNFTVPASEAFPWYTFTFLISPFL